MKRLCISLLCLAASMAIFANFSVNKLEPSFWWAGMKNPELQIMVYGNNIGDAQVQIQTPGVVLKNIVKADSPDYLFIYLDLSKAAPGNISLTFSQGKEKKKVNYELKARVAGSESRKSFTSADVIYLLMPDRFANGNKENDNLVMKNSTEKVDRNDPGARHGGDLAGIEQHLDYLADFGITAIWPTPVLKNDIDGSYHGYAITDFYHIDPRFGSNEEYKSLIEKSHQKDIKMIMDMIFNHCGREHIWYKNPPFKDWFNFRDNYTQANANLNVIYDSHASQRDRKVMNDGAFAPSMPDLNQRNPHLARYLIQNSIWWIEYAGLDGIRQDTYPYPDPAMMSKWCKEVMTEYPDFNIVGEAWYFNTVGCAFWQAHSKLNKNGDSNLKTVMDFSLMQSAYKAFNEETKWNTGLTRIYEIVGLDFLYEDINNLLVFWENHDTERFLSKLPENLSIFKQAYAYLFTTRGIPQIYYGVEILMNGSKDGNDGNVRRDFPGGWKEDTTNAFTPEGRTPLQNEAYDYLKKLLNWRKNNEIISRGTLVHFKPVDGVYVYARSYENKHVLVIMNGTNEAKTIALNNYMEVFDGKVSGKDVITSKTVDLEKDLNMMARETLILEY